MTGGSSDPEASGASGRQVKKAVGPWSGHVAAPLRPVCVRATTPRFPHHLSVGRAPPANFDGLISIKRSHHVTGAS
jgi:hypothetical protein